MATNVIGQMIVDGGGRCKGGRTMYAPFFDSADLAMYVWRAMNWGLRVYEVLLALRRLVS